MIPFDRSDPSLPDEIKHRQLLREAGELVELDLTPPAKPDAPDPTAAPATPNTSSVLEVSGPELESEPDAVLDRPEGEPEALEAGEEEDNKDHEASEGETSARSRNHGKRRR